MSWLGKLLGSGGSAPDLKTYPLGIVGESNYQAEIRRCKPGERVHVLHEIGNPYDEQALVVLSERGEKLGYIARDCWLQRAVHNEGKSCGAIIFNLRPGPNGTGVVINLQLKDGEIEQCEYRR